MRKGFTTGSCAAAASKAAAYMLLSGKEKSAIEIQTPAGIVFEAQIVDIQKNESYVSCAVIKDGGDDPDVTTGSHIVSKVSIVEDSFEKDMRSPLKVVIDGGIGVGRVSKPGLDQKVGNAAINHVPREMILKEVTEVCSFFDFNGILKVEISVPEGEELAKRTFNPRLGIEGGISILGTTGIVEPMSTKAILDTIRVELNQKKALGQTTAIVSPGNFGQQFMKDNFGYDLDMSVKCSNFIGETIDMVCEMEFEKMVLTGHIGKLIKVAGGIMNTHSHEADCRMEILACCAILANAEADIAKKILGCTNTEEALHIVEEAGMLKETMDIVLEKVLFYLNFRAQGKIQIECVIYSGDYGILAKSSGAKDLLM
ncbi:cobalt-precorrin-5B (C(1))-methyltransferase CbiD [Butyrivibrio sp.]|uniref:cobalt-precorrin-5B (C(1))-methyltransferase CbiD n=1 Tax=Butyrivibrio sp. TaxID=28121 RepID=UPI0025C1B3E8|nr:cobalt-precorrin-5B (C(1))-methyltransferase CbiD [Butyrivibrio sp.]MBQ9304865.1 cobalamin biosynthesis protein CbiD [Butyrivibrio sp.]